jgi:hypothetical protein
MADIGNGENSTYIAWHCYLLSILISNFWSIFGLGIGMPWRMPWSALVGAMACQNESTPLKLLKKRLVWRVGDGCSIKIWKL